jgi:hypothetical protein
VYVAEKNPAPLVARFLEVLQNGGAYPRRKHDPVRPKAGGQGDGLQERGGVQAFRER